MSTMPGNSWDVKLMGLCASIAAWSKDRSRKVGAIIVAENNSVIATGYNGFPRGVNDDVNERHERPAKYKWTEHAERNSLYHAAYAGIPVKGARLYSSLFPCMDCARGVIQSGIVEIITYEPDWHDPIWHKDFADVPNMLSEAGVRWRFLECPGFPVEYAPQIGSAKTVLAKSVPVTGLKTDVKTDGTNTTITLSSGSTVYGNLFTGQKREVQKD